MRITKWSLVFAIFFLFMVLGRTEAMASSVTHTVVKGDNLWKIAKKYGVNWGAIAEENGIKNVRALQIGTVLNINLKDKSNGTVSAKSANKENAAQAYKEYTVSIQNGEHKIPAIICLPNRKGPFPGVVMLHGTGSNKNEAGNGYKLAAPELAKAGIASIRIDFIGNGDSTEDYINYNFTTAVSDANAAAKYLAKLKGIDGNRIGIMGWSQGGTIAMLAAGQNNNFKSVVTWAGAPDLSMIATDEAYNIAKKDGFYKLTFDWRSPLRLGLKWFEEVHATDVLKVFSNSSAPVLAINGAVDTDVDPSNAKKIAATSKNKISKAMLIEGADHTFNIFTDDKRAFNKLVSSTVDWFSKTLAK
ncbi:alpha/beta fold hydrolase [Brevibacillus ginsengisoli]|uniref:alpha/beta fold hydrolase n=1 Tax=Brevibacillus ginsengisoli TaxID=363854 RepID=UPI003CF82E9B